MGRQHGQELDHTYAVCEQLLTEGKYALAERRLWQQVRRAPRAAQSVLLLGVSHLLQGKFEQAAAIIDKAYELKPWVRDDFSHFLEIYEAAAAAAKALPHWQWPAYLFRKDRYQWVGLDVGAALAFFAEHEGRAPFFVQVGANDGRRGDPISRAVRSLGLRGLLVEPIPEVFERLKENYRAAQGRLTFVNAAIAASDGPVELFLDTSGPSTVSSLVPDRNVLRGSKRRLKSVRVEGMTLQTLLNAHAVPEMHMLQIDTEGYDYNILAQAKLRDCGTKIVNMEFYCLPIEERMKSFDIFDGAGMAYVFDGMDLLAVDREMYGREFCIFERSNEQAQ